MQVLAYQVFAAVVEHKSFIGAAESLHFTPSAISHSITKLEKTMGLQLFERTRTGAHLTEDGKALLPYVMDILNAEERFVQKVSGIKGLECGNVCIGTVNSVCINWIPDIVKSFRALYPNMEISICEGGYSDELTWLQMGYADMCFVSTTVVNDKLDFITLFQDRMMCVTHKNFRPVNHDYVTAEDIKGQTIIFQRDGYDAETNAVLQSLGINVASRFAVESDHSIVTLIECEMGISMLPELVLRKIMHAASVYPVEPPVYRTLGLATLKNRPLSAAAKKMRSHIIATFKCGGNFPSGSPLVK